MFSQILSHEWSEDGEGGGAKGNSSDLSEARISACCCAISASFEARAALVAAREAWWRRGLAAMARFLVMVWGVLVGEGGGQGGCKKGHREGRGDA